MQGDMQTGLFGLQPINLEVVYWFLSSLPFFFLFFVYVCLCVCLQLCEVACVNIQKVGSFKSIF